MTDQYFAFISYSHKDKAVAEALHHYLEHYRIPAQLRRQHAGLPQNMRPVFLDQKELAIDQYDKSLKTAVENSRFYIAICSEHSAKPNPDTGKHYVEEGLKFFLKLQEGDTSKIVPIIVRSGAEGRVEDKYLPPTIRKHQIHAADMGVLGKDRAFNDVAAKLLGVQPDELWRRWEREQRKRRRIKQTAAAATLAAAAGGAWWAYDYYTPKELYYADYVECGNAPVGLHKLGKAETGSRQYHYRFTVCEGKVRSVRRCNSQGRPFVAEEDWDTKDKPCGVEYTYTEVGAVDKATYFDPYGYPTMELTYNGEHNGKGWSSVVYRPVKGEGTTNLDATMVALTNKRWVQGEPTSSNVTWHKLSYDDRGYISRRLYMGDAAVAVPDHNGVYGVQYERDGKGRVVSLTYLGADGTPTQDNNGIRGMKMEYDDASGLVAYVENVGKDGGKVFNKNHWAALRIQRDASGNPYSCVVLDPQGNPCRHKLGMSRMLSTFDANGYETGTLMQDEAGKPCISSNGISKVTIEYDAKGNPYKMTSFDIEGAPCAGNDGHAIIERTFDAQGRVLTESIKDAHGKPCYGKEKVSKIAKKYDKEHGWLTEEAFFGPEGAPSANAQGYAKVTLSYDGQGNETAREFFDVDGDPTELEEGYAKCESRYDKANNTSTLLHYDATGKPCKIKGGYSAIVLKHDLMGNISAIEYKDENGQPVCCDKGYAKQAIEYDPQGRPVYYCHYDEKNNVCNDEDGCAQTRFTYDENGRPVRQEFLGKDGRPCPNNEGYAIIKTEYDANGNISTFSVFDTEGNPTDGNIGYAVKKMEYDIQGNMTEVRYFSADGTPSYDADGAPVIRSTFNGLGHLTSMSYHHADGTPYPDKQGHARSEFVNDVQGRTLEVRLYDGNGAPCTWGRTVIAKPPWRTTNAGNL